MYCIFKIIEQLLTYNILIIYYQNIKLKLTTNGRVIIPLDKGFRQNEENLFYTQFIQKMKK